MRLQALLLLASAVSVFGCAPIDIPDFKPESTPGALKHATFSDGGKIDKALMVGTTEYVSVDSDKHDLPAHLAITSSDAKVMTVDNVETTYWCIVPATTQPDGSTAGGGFKVEEGEPCPNNTAPQTWYSVTVSAHAKGSADLVLATKDGAAFDHLTLSTAPAASLEVASVEDIDGKPVSLDALTVGADSFSIRLLARDANNAPLFARNGFVLSTDDPKVVEVSGLPGDPPLPATMDLSWLTAKTAGATTLRAKTEGVEGAFPVVVK